MRPAFLATLLMAFLCTALPATAQTSTTKKPTPAQARAAAAKKKQAKAKHTKPTAKANTHLAMDSARATEIQTALIKSGYLSGQPTGTWDAQSMAAMQKLQSDNGWQTKIVPDSRALIKLGLGPNATSPQ